jgi:hypothetical protein
MLPALSSFGVGNIRAIASGTNTILAASTGATSAAIYETLPGDVIWIWLWGETIPVPGPAAYIPVSLTLREDTMTPTQFRVLTFFADGVPQAIDVNIRWVALAFNAGPVT